MDLISQIVATKENVEVEEIQRDLDKLWASVESLKRGMEQELNDLLKCPFRRFNSAGYPKDLLQLSETNECLEKRVKTMKLNDTCEIDSRQIEFFQKIKEIFDQLTFLKDIETIDRNMKSMKQLGTSNHFKTAYRLMESKTLVDGYMKRNDFETFCQFKDFFKYVMNKFCFCLSVLEHHLTTIWNSSVSFVVNDKRIKNVKANKVNLVLNSDPSLDLLLECFEVLRCPVITEDFSCNVLDCLLKPVLLHRCKVTVYSTASNISLSLTYRDQPSKSDIGEVLCSLITIFDVLNSNFKFKVKASKPFLSSVGAHCEDELTSLLIEHHLSNISADASQDLLDLCQQLILALLKNSFIGSGSKLLRCLEDIILRKNTHMMTHYVNCGLNLIKKDLFNSIYVQPIEVTLSTSECNHYFPDVTMNTQTVRLDSVNSCCFNKSDKLYLFPGCQVSQSVRELALFFEEILTKVSDEDSLEHKSTLCRSVQEIVDKYLTSPNLHSSSPTNSALIFNNSMYLAVNLIYFDKNYNVGYLFCGSVYKLQNLARFELDKVVISEQVAIAKSLRQSGLMESMEEEILPEGCCSTIKGCLKQLQQLQGSWMTILPVDIYKMAMGRLCNRLIDEIISIVMSARKVNSTVKKSLHKLFLFISESIKQIIKDEENMEKLVSSWAKWSELSLFLNGNLSTVSVRWDKKKGPLARHFNHLQARDLVTALFPPSDRRHKVLTTVIM